MVGRHHKGQVSGKSIRDALSDNHVVSIKETIRLPILDLRKVAFFGDAADDSLAHGRGQDLVLLGVLKNLKKVLADVLSHPVL